MGNGTTRDALPLVLRFRQWRDDVTERTGFPMRSSYVETYWLPTLGPTTTLLARRLSLYVGDGAVEQAVDGINLALSLGLAPRLDYYATLPRSLRRLIDFKIARGYDDGAFEIRRAMPPLPDEYRVRLPRFLRDSLDRLPANTG